MRNWSGSCREPQQRLEVAAFGDYAITPVTAPRSSQPCPARGRAHGGAEVRGMHYPDFHQSRAFALADHQVAPVPCPIPPPCRARPRFSAGWTAWPRCWTGRTGRAGIDIPAPRPAAGGVAGRWFAYPWWRDAERPPITPATSISTTSRDTIRANCFFGRSPFRTCQDPARVRGTHGMTAPTVKRPSSQPTVRLLDTAGVAAALPHVGGTA
jgi:hypothetical protein